MNEKVISLAAAKAKQAQSKSQIALLTTEQVLEAFHEVVMCPHVFVQGLVNRLVPYVNMDFLDVDGLRGFLIDVINCIHNDGEMLQEWITDHLMDDSEDYSGMGSLFPTKPRTRNERFSDVAYSIVTGGGLRERVLEFSACVFWIINGDYVHEKQIAVSDFIAGAIIRNYDFDANFNQTLDDSLSCCPAWFVSRTMMDNWYFAAIMADGDMVEFNHLHKIADNDGFYAYVDTDSGSMIQENDVEKYTRKVIKKDRMSICVKNIVTRKASDGSLWLDAEMVECYSFDMYRTKVSINAKHVSSSRLAAGEDGVTMLFFDIKSLRIPKKEYDGALRLFDIVMVFETADT